MKKNAEPPASGKAGNASIVFASATGVLRHHRAERLRGLGDDGVMHPAPFLPRRDKAAVHEQLHVMRKRRLRNPQVCQEIACALFPLLQSAEDRQAVRVCQRMKAPRILGETICSHPLFLLPKGSEERSSINLPYILKNVNI